MPGASASPPQRRCNSSTTLVTVLLVALIAVVSRNRLMPSSSHVSHRGATRNEVAASEKAAAHLESLLSDADRLAETRDLKHAFEHFPPAGKDFPRVPILADFDVWVQQEAGAGFTGCGESFIGGAGDDPELRFLPSTTECEEQAAKARSTGGDAGDGSTPAQLRQSCEFDGSPRCDLHQLAMGRKYDFILLSQTFEHIYDPPLAMCRVQQHARPGSWLFLSIPTYNRPHMVPSHFRHYTPRGLYALLVGSGYEVRHLGAWGSKTYVQLVHNTGGWPDYRSFMAEGASTLPEEHRDPEHTVQVWALARYVGPPSSSSSSSGSGSGSGSKQPAGGLYDCSDAALRKRPLVDLHKLDVEWARLWRPEGPPWTVPTYAAVKRVLRAVTGWKAGAPDLALYDVLDAPAMQGVDLPLLLAAAGILHLTASAGDASTATALQQAPASVLTHGAVSALFPGTTATVTSRSITANIAAPAAPSIVLPASGGGPGGKYAAAILSDLLEYEIDALTTLTDVVKPAISPGGAVYILCRVHMPLDSRASHLTTCMPSGLTTVMMRADMTVEASGGWGSTDALLQTLVEGRYPPLQAWLEANTAYLLEAGSEDGVPKAQFHELVIAWARGRWQ